MSGLYWHDVNSKEQLSEGDIVSFKNIGQWHDKGVVESIGGNRTVSVRFPKDGFNTVCDFSTLYKWDENDWCTKEQADYWIALLERCAKNNPNLDWSENEQKIENYKSRVTS